MSMTAGTLGAHAVALNDEVEQMPETQEHTRPVVELARKNDEFRKVLWPGEKTQLVLMAIPEGGDIGGKVHKGHDQLL